MAASGGSAVVVLNGVQYTFLSNDLTVNAGGYAREPIDGDEGGNFTKRIIPGVIEGTVVTKPALSVLQIRAIEDAPITVTLANGTRYISDAAYTMDCDPIDAGGGTMKVRIGTMGPMRELT